MAKRVSTEDFDDQVLGAQVPVLVDFYSDTCVPCKRLAPRLARLEAELGGALLVAKVNVGFDLELAERYGVTASPTLLIFREGKELARHQGVLSPDELGAFVAQAL